MTGPTRCRIVGRSHEQPSVRHQLVAALGPDQGVDARIASGAFGVASVGFAALALLWPDVTLLITAILWRTA